MTGAPSLRDYQAAAVTHVETRLATEPRCYFELPTGTGKTRVLGTLARRARQHGGRVLAVAHTVELVEQLRTGLAAAVGEPAGVVMASANEPAAGLVVGSVQTLRTNRLEAVLAAGPVALLIIDECHHATAVNGYGRLVERVVEANPGVRVVGATATPYRADRHRMTDVVGGCAFARSMRELTAAGWLAPLTWRQVKIDDLNLGAVRMGRSEGDTDYRTDELASAMSNLDVVAATAQLTGPLVANRLTIAFACDVTHAHALTAAYRKAGLNAATVWGDQPRDERAAVLASWRTGGVQIVVNVGVLVEGFDLPELAAVVMARPTASPGAYVQRLGRVTRTAPGKADALVLDVTGSGFGPESFDARQVTLPVLDGIASGSVGDGDLDHGGRPERTLRVLNPLGAAPIEWGTDPASGAYYAGAGRGFAVVLVPDPSGLGGGREGSSGLYLPVLVETRADGSAQKITHGPAPLREAVGAACAALARAGRLSVLTDKRSSWRSAPATLRQLDYLRLLDAAEAARAEAHGRSRGEVGVAITGALVQRRLPALRDLWGSTRSRIPAGRGDDHRDARG